MVDPVCETQPFQTVKQLRNFVIMKAENAVVQLVILIKLLQYPNLALQFIWIFEFFCETRGSFRISSGNFLPVEVNERKVFIIKITVKIQHG